MTCTLCFLCVLVVSAGSSVFHHQDAKTHKETQRRTEVRRYSLAARDSEPYNATALYGLANVLLRSNQREEGQRLLQDFQVLRQSGAGTSIGTNYLEQGHYAEAVTSTGAEAGLVERRTPEVVFTEATAHLDYLERYNTRVVTAPVTKTVTSDERRVTSRKKVNRESSIVNRRKWVFSIHGSRFTIHGFAPIRASRLTAFALTCHSSLVTAL